MVFSIGNSSLNRRCIAFPTVPDHIWRSIVNIKNQLVLSCDRICVFDLDFQLCNMIAGASYHTTSSRHRNKAPGEVMASGEVMAPAVTKCENAARVRVLCCAVSIRPSAIQQPHRVLL